MSRVSRARKVAAAAAYGGGGLTVLGALGVGVITAEMKLARRWIGEPFEPAPQADGVYGAGLGPPLELAVVGDSSAAGMGADAPERTPGAVIARGLSAVAGRPVRLTTVAVVGAQSSQLPGQLDRLLAATTPDVTVVMIGANDVSHRVRPAVSVRHLSQTVERLRAVGSEVVVGTCPDLGTIEPVAQPLRLIARRLSRDLAAAQTVAAVEAGARSVSLGDLLGPEFRRVPAEMFSADRFHPSSAGYAAAAAALLPSVCAAVGLWPDGGAERAPDRRRGEGVGPVTRAAVAAAADPGTEVQAVEVAGESRGPRGRWVVLRRRRREPVPAGGPDHADGPEPAVGVEGGQGGAAEGAGAAPVEGAAEASDGAAGSARSAGSDGSTGAAGWGRSRRFDGPDGMARSASSDGSAGSAGSAGVASAEGSGTPDG
jgi:lysophospholipase L1-like esterase